MNMIVPSTTTQSTVLYVDQEETASKYIRAKFAADYNLLFAHSAMQALAYLHDDTRHIDVIVTDDKLPDRSESKLLLQAIEAHPYIECILVTADAPRELVTEQKKQGRPWQVLEKPVNLDEVGIAICTALVRSMRRQMRCQRYEAMKDTVHFLGEYANSQHDAIRNLCERILDPSSDNHLDKASLRQEASIVLSGSKKMRYQTLFGFRTALRNTGHGIENESTHTTAGKLITDIISKMPLSQEELSYIGVEIRNDFQLQKTAALMDLLLTNIIILALESVRKKPDPRSIGISVCIEGAPQIIITDNGDGAEIKTDSRADNSDHLQSPNVTILKFCGEIMNFLGGTLLVTSYPISESQIVLEFPVFEEYMS